MLWVMDGRDVFVADRYLHQHHVQALSLDQHPQVQTLHYRRYISKNDVPQAAQENWRLENQPPLHLWVVQVSWVPPLAVERNLSQVPDFGEQNKLGGCLT